MTCEWPRDTPASLHARTIVATCAGDPGDRRGA